MDPVRGAKGPVGVNLVSLIRGQNRLLSLQRYCSFHWQTGAELCQGERAGRGAGRGQAPAPGKGARLPGLPFLFTQKGAWRGEAGSTTVDLWSQGDMRSQPPQQHPPRPSALCAGLWAPGSRSTVPPPAASVPSPGCLTLMKMRRQQVTLDLFPFKGPEGCC